MLVTDIMNPSNTNADPNRLGSAAGGNASAATNVEKLGFWQKKRELEKQQRQARTDGGTTGTSHDAEPRTLNFKMTAMIRNKL
jgi:hypothetical protein